jgi:hypothetical protein
VNRPVARIVSGGQTGVDRAALDAALALGLPCGGWCPKGRRAEDGPIAERYPLLETDSPRYAARTRMNVLAADGTLILNRGALDGGSALTAAFARERGKPLLVLALDEADALARVRAWVAAHRIAVLNVAGPRESRAPGIYAGARAFLERLLAGDRPVA